MPITDIGNYYRTELQEASADAYAAYLNLAQALPLVKNSAGDQRRLKAAMRKAREVSITADSLSSRYDPEGNEAEEMEARK